MLEIVNEELSEKKVQKENVKLPRIELKELPSKFLDYPKGTKIYYEPITLEELEILNNSEGANIELALDYLMNSIHCNTMNAEDLACFDVLFIGIKRKLTALGDIKGIVANYCPKCGNLVNKEFNYTELEFQELQIEALPAIVELTEDKIDLEFGLISMKDFKTIEEDEPILNIYARMVKNKSYEEAKDILKNLYGEDIKKVQTIEKLLSYGIKSLKTRCLNKILKSEIIIDDNGIEKEITAEKSCNAEVEMEVTSPFEISFPSSESDESYKSQIRFGH